MFSLVETVQSVQEECHSSQNMDRLEMLVQTEVSNHMHVKYVDKLTTNVFFERELKQRHVLCSIKGRPGGDVVASREISASSR